MQRKLFLVNLVIALCALGLQGFAQAPAIHFGMYDTEDPCVVGHATKGQTTYAINVRNEGTAPCMGIQLEDKIPQQMEFVSANGPAPFKCQDGKVTFETVPILPPGEVLNFQVVCKALQPGIAKNIAMLKWESLAEPAIQEEVTTVVNPGGADVAALHLGVYDTEDPVSYIEPPFNNTQYVTEVRNEGTQPCTNVKLEDRIPSQMEFVAAKGPQSFKVEDGKVKFDAVPSLKPGEVLTYRVTCKAITPGYARNTVLVTCDQFSEPIRRDEVANLLEQPVSPNRKIMMLDFLVVSPAGTLLGSLPEKGTVSLHGSIGVPLSYPLGDHANPYLAIGVKPVVPNKIEITMGYYSQFFREGEQPGEGTVLLATKKLVIPEWQPAMVLLEGQEEKYHKIYLRVIPDLQRKEEPSHISRFTLHLENFYFIDLQEQKLLAAGGVTGQIIGINIPDKGLFEFSLQKFTGASIHGIVSGNEISIFDQAKYGRPRYKIVATNPIVGGNQYWVWVAQKPARKNGGISIEAISDRREK